MKDLFLRNNDLLRADDVELDTDKFMDLVNQMKDIVFPVVIGVILVVFVFLCVKLGWRIMQAGADGDADGRKQALHDAKWVIVGLVLCALSVTIAGVMYAVLGVG